MQPQYELQAAKGLHKILLHIMNSKEYVHPIRCLKFFAVSGTPSKDTNVYLYEKSKEKYIAKINFGNFFDGIISYPNPWEIKAVYDNLVLWLTRGTTCEARDIAAILNKRIVTTMHKGSNYNAYGYGQNNGKDLIIEWDKEALNTWARGLYIYIAALEQGKSYFKTRDISMMQNIRALMSVIEEADDDTKEIIFENNQIKLKYFNDNDNNIPYDTYFKVKPEPWDIHLAMSAIREEVSDSVFANTGVQKFYKESCYFFRTSDASTAEESWCNLYDVLDVYISNTHISSQDVTVSQTQADNNKEKLGSVSHSDKLGNTTINPNSFDVRYNHLVLRCNSQAEHQLINGLRFKGTNIEDIERAFQLYQDIQRETRQTEIKRHISPPLHGPFNFTPTPIIFDDREFKIPSLKDMYNKIFRKKKEKQMEPIINNITSKVKNLSPDTVTKIAAVALVLLVIGKYSLVKKLLVDVKKNVQESDSYKEIVKDSTTVVANAKKLVGLDKKAGE